MENDLLGEQEDTPFFYGCVCSVLCVCCCLFMVFVFFGVLCCLRWFYRVNLICHLNFQVCACATETSERYTFRVKV